MDAHPLIREYFAKQLIEKNPDAWRAAHRRLYEYLRDTTLDLRQPTIDDLQPLYQAVAHGCKAGLHEEASAKVYRDRILRGTSGPDAFYNVNKLGGFGDNLRALASFYEIPWSQLEPAFGIDEKAWLLSETAFSIRALKRLLEALQPMRD
jgi:hypothetical protein